MKSRKEEALERIRELITSGQYKQGATFSENELSSQLGVSRTPIRDALASLVSEGLVEQTPQVGVRVKVFSDKDLREVFIIRERLEPYAAGELARCTQNDAELDVLHEHLEQMRLAAHRGEIPKFLRNDIDFHAGTASLLNLPLYAEVLRRVSNRVLVFGFLSTPNSDSMKIVVAEHDSILKAIEQREPDRAAELAREHIQLTRNRLEKAKGYKIF